MKLALLLLLLCLGPPAHAASYEGARLDLVLAERGLARVERPEGLPIHTIHIVRHEVFVEDELWPTFLNVFHALSREETVARELLFAIGEPYDPARVDETSRKLRDQGIFALVRIAAVRGPDTPPDSVDVLVFTRDLWSLRLETAFSFNDGHFDSLALTLIERNLFGRNVQAALNFDLLPMTWAIGGQFVDRRLFSSRLSLAALATLVFSREDSAPEGSLGSLTFGLPLWDLRKRWGFTAAFAWDTTASRQLSGTRLLTWDDPDTDSTEAIPRIWSRDQLTASLTASRQLPGEHLIHRLSFGYAAAIRRYTPHPDTGLASGSAAARAFAASVLPPSRDQLYPFLRWEAFTPTWAAFTDLGAYGLTEDVRAGLGLDLSVAFPLEAFGSDVDALTWELGLTLTFAPRAGPDRALIDLYAGLAGRLEQGEVIDQAYRARLRGASPRLFFGRLVLSAEVEGRGADSARTLVTLGGDNGLRGYPSQHLYAFGGDRVRLNLEARTPPLVVGSIHVGAVLFCDAGGVASSLSELTLATSLGLGLRALLPQFNRFAFRFDVGFPLSGGATALLSFGSSQMVPLTALEDDRLAQ